MIRVLVRHVDDAEGTLLGDFPPSEIRPMLEVLDAARIYWSDTADDCEVDSTQLVLGGGTGAPRYVLEVLLE
jgi:hypothetical protein